METDVVEQLTVVALWEAGLDFVVSNFLTKLQGPERVKIRYDF